MYSLVNLLYCPWISLRHLLPKREEPATMDAQECPEHAYLLASTRRLGRLAANVPPTPTSPQIRECLTSQASAYPHLAMARPLRYRAKPQTVIFELNSREPSFQFRPYKPISYLPRVNIKR